MKTASEQPQTADDSKIIAELSQAIGAKNLLQTPDDMAPFSTDWTHHFSSAPLAVARPHTSNEVSQIVQICAEHKIAIVPQGGNTGLCGGSIPTQNRKSIILSLSRMNKIRAIDPVARTATVDAGVVLEVLQKKVAELDLLFPLMFGARGSCTIGGNLSTNAGGSNVIRYGNTRELCLGIEAVLPDGSIINALTGLRKDNTGYDLKNLLIGAEGTLGIITGAVVKLAPQPKVRATAFLSLAALKDAGDILNKIQDTLGGTVEAYEYMPRPIIEAICSAFPDIRAPLEQPAEVGILLEVASSRMDDCAELDDGTIALETRLLETLSELMESEHILDATFASSEQHRLELWHMRESVLESIGASGTAYHLDIALPLSNIDGFIKKMDVKAQAEGFRTLTIGHLGDGNLHYALLAEKGRDWDSLDLDGTKAFAFELLAKMNGSFSAEHGIGLTKKDLLNTYKEPSQHQMMRLIKTALDPNNIMNPDKMVTL